MFNGGPICDTPTGHADIANAVAFSPDGSILAAGGGNTTVLLWDVVRRSRVATLTTAEQGSVIALRFSPDGRTLATAGNDTTVLLWDTARHAVRARLDRPPDQRLHARLRPAQRPARLRRGGRHHHPLGHDASLPRRARRAGR